jgi:hypothetical protein
MLSGYWGNKELDNLLTGGDQLMVALSADTMHEGWGKVKNWLTRWVSGDEVFTGSERGGGRDPVWCGGWGEGVAEEANIGELVSGS